MIQINKITEVQNYLDGLEAVIFDLDDTLYGEKEYVRRGYREVAKLLSQIQNTEEKMWSFFEQGFPAIDKLLETEGISSDVIKQKCVQTYRNHIPEIHLYDGAYELLISLRKRSYRLGIITDGRPEGQRAKIEALGLTDYVDRIIITDELGGPQFRKPNPQAFVMMREYLDVPYERMCYVGDNIKKDFIAPELLGIQSLYYRNPNGLYYV